MKEAARVGAPTSHPGSVTGPGVPKVRIEGLAAAVVGDAHACSLPPPAGPHPPSTVVQGSRTVRIGGRSAARFGDAVGCGATIVLGSLRVRIWD